MGKEILTFSDIEIEKISSGEINYKFFIVYLCNDCKIKALLIMLPKTSGYIKCYDGHTK